MATSLPSHYFNLIFICRTIRQWNWMELFVVVPLGYEWGLDHIASQSFLGNFHQVLFWQFQAFQNQVRATESETSSTIQSTLPGIQCKYYQQSNNQNIKYIHQYIFTHKKSFAIITKKISLIVQECGATDCFHSLCLPLRYWALSKVQTLCLDVVIGQTWKDSFRCDEMTPKVSYWPTWLQRYWKPKCLGLTQLPPQSESDSNLPGDDSEKWSPTSEKQVSIQKLFIWHHTQITICLRKTISAHVSSWTPSSRSRKIIPCQRQKQNS